MITVLRGTCAGRDYDGDTIMDVRGRDTGRDRGGDVTIFRGRDYGGDVIAAGT